MGILRAPGTGGILLAACLGSAGVAHAACTGPQALVAQLRTHPTTENAVLLGSWYASHQQFECAVATFRMALKADSKSAQLHYLTGLALVGEKQEVQALPELQEAARLDPQVIKPHLLLATLFDAAGRHEEAEAQWRQALAIDPKSEQALEGLSADLMARKDYAGVVQLLHPAPRTEKLSITLSQALGLLNYLDEAANVLNQAMQVTPNSLPLASALTVVLVKQVKYQDAINLLQKAVEAHPGNTDAELQLFRLLVLTNHINAARPLGPKLLAARPHDADVLYLNGIVDRTVGDYPTARQHLEQAISLEPNFFHSRYNLGMVLVFLHEWKDAKEQLEKALALGATEPEVHFELAKALRGLGDMEGAQAQMKQYQQMKRDEESATEAAMAAAEGDKNLDAGKLDEAIRHYRDAAEAAPQSASYKFKLAIALQRSGDTKGERAQLEHAVQLDPKLAGAQNALGYLLSESGDSAGAIEHFRLAVQAAPEWPDAWINLAAELATNAQFAEAKQAAAKALELDPENAQAKALNDQLARDPAAQQSHP
jgi:Flp pilus assembly protein TadD